MSMFLFRDRASVLDDRSRSFLTTVAWLGGYVTPEQAQLLGIRNSAPRGHVQLKGTGGLGLLKTCRRVSVDLSGHEVSHSADGN